jgi:hypothetical protein
MLRVVDIATDGTLNANDALRLAAAVERDSEHTIRARDHQERRRAVIDYPKTQQFRKRFRAMVRGRWSTGESSTSGDRRCCTGFR